MKAARKVTPIRKLPRGAAGRGIVAALGVIHERLKELNEFYTIRVGLFIYKGDEPPADQIELLDEPYFAFSVNDALNHTEETIRRLIAVSKATPKPRPELVR